MNNIENIGKIIGEEIAFDPGICLYPGKFKPPHIGHWDVAKDLASRNYVTELAVMISPRTVEGITAEQSYAIWKIYLKCEPNSKIKIYKSATNSPVKDAYAFIEKNDQAERFYLVGGKDEVDNQNYFKSFQKKFDDKVFVIGVEEKHNRISATYVRKMLAEKDFERFKKTLPPGAVSKGYAQEIYDMLIATFTLEKPINESCDEPNNIFNEFISDNCDILEITDQPEIIFLNEPLSSGDQLSFGGFVPSINTIYVCAGERHPVDIMRTLAHELVHCKQHLEGQLSSPEDGKTGSSVENEANAVAGMLMRRYAKTHPELF